MRGRNVLTFGSATSFFITLPMMGLIEKKQFVPEMKTVRIYRVVELNTSFSSSASFPTCMWCRCLLVDASI